jgi:hypothetical protein
VSQLAEERSAWDMGHYLNQLIRRETLGLALAHRSSLPMAPGGHRPARTTPGQPLCVVSRRSEAHNRAQRAMERELPIIPYDALLPLCGRILATASSLEVRLVVTSRQTPSPRSLRILTMHGAPPHEAHIN